MIAVALPEGFAAGCPAFLAVWGSNAMTTGDVSTSRVSMGATLRMTVLPLLLAMLVTGFMAARKPVHVPELDEFYYMTIARDLALHGVFTDGMFKAGPFGEGSGPGHFGDEGPQWNKPGRFFAPAYPWIIYALGKLDPGLATAVHCHVANGHSASQSSCPMSFRSLLFANILLWSLGMFAIFSVARHATGSEVIGWVAFGLALSTGEAPLYARTYLSENIAIPAFLVFMMFAVRALAYRHVLDYALAGALLGVAALARPSYVYMLYLLVAVAIGMSIWGRRRDGFPRGAHVLAFIGACGLVLAPWLMRNMVQFGDPSISRGYAEVILMQRVSYNRMSIGEWLVAMIYWLPDFGDNVAAALFPQHLYARLDFDNPKGFYLEGGSGAFRNAILREAGNTAQVFDLLFKTYVLGDLPWHTLVTVPLTVRGMGVGRYLSVAGVLLAWPAIKYFLRHGRLHLLLILALPSLVMTGLHGFVSVNIARYNLSLLCVYATIVAVVVVEAADTIRARTRKQDGRPT